MPRLLLIDDDDLVRAVLATALTRAGHAVVQAGDGRQGVRLFAAEPADLVITDLVMPDREGLEVITELRRGWPEVPIIAMSGGLPRSDFYLDMAGRLGARRLLAKPFAPDVLLRAVDELLAPPAPAPR